MIYYVFGYRKKVVLDNLKNSFPEKTEAEIKKICKGFYRHFSDFLVESVKSITISKKQVRERCRFDDEANQLINKLFIEKKSVLGVLGHYGNWEWAAPAFSLSQQPQLFVVYKHLSNQYFDAFMYNLRSRFGAKLIESKSVAKEMFRGRDNASVTIFVGDQTPGPDNAYWTKFLNQETPIFRGTEVIAKKFNLPVVFVSVRKQKRGYYMIHAEILSENPGSTRNGEISELHTKKLEAEIYRQPEIWLWSHRRWKHKMPLLTTG